ncbi:MAG: VWA domain-containing protein [Myxococcales bacterium]|nr:VWA domain-containing protein [Myxococcales bacterium]
MSALSFARPELLWGLVLAAVPVLIHLINRRRARRQPFAALDFLLRVQRRHARRLLLRQVLLLVLRTLAVMLAVLAAAGPRFQPPAVGATAGPRATVIVLDGSFSMRYAPGGRSMFERARELAREEIRAREPGECIGLVVAQAPGPRVLLPCRQNIGELLEALEHLGPGNGASELGPSLEEAARLLAEAPAGRRRILVLSDLAAHAFPRAPVWPASGAPEVALAELLPIGTERPNRAVLEVEARPERRQLMLRSRLVSFSGRDEKGILVQVGFKDEVSVSGFADLPARQEVLKVFHPPMPPETTQGWVALRPDDLPGDDRVPFWAGAGGVVSVLLVNGDPQPVLARDELYFIERALAPDPGEGSGILSRSVAADLLREEDLVGVQAVVLANVAGLRPGLVEALRGFVRDGGGLLVAVGERLDPARASESYADLLVRPLRDVVTLQASAAEDGSGMAFAPAAARHPLLATPGSEEALDLSRVRTERAMVTEPGGGDDARVVLAFENGVPALLEKTLGRGRLLLWSTTLDRDWTRWPARASFVPFWQRVCFYLAGRLGRPAPPRVDSGQPVPLDLAEEGERLQVIRPDGERVALAPGQRYFEDTALCGWYEIRTDAGGGPREGMPGFVVSPPAAESDLKPISPERLAEWVGKAQLSWRAGGDGARRPLALECLGLLLLLLFGEAWLVRRG